MPAQEGALPESSTSFISKILPYVVLVIFCALSFVAYWYFDTQKTAAASRLVDQRIVEYVNQMGDRLDRDVAILRGVQGLFNASDSVTGKEFTDYLTAINLSDNYPGIYSIAYAARVQEADIPVFLKSMKQDTSVHTEGYPDVEIYPTTTDSEHYIIQYIFPEEQFKSGLGFDMTSETHRKEALLHAIKTKKPTLSKKVSLISDNAEAVLLLLPVEKSGETVGVVMVTLQLDTFFTGVTANLATPEKFFYTIAEIDRETGVGEEFYSSGDATRMQGQAIVKKQRVEFGEKTWELTFTAEATYGFTGLVKFLPLGVAELIAAIGGLVFLMLFQSSRVKDRAIRLAEGMVVDLKESEGRFQAITESAKDAIVMMDSKARVVLWNNAAARMFGWTEREMLGQPFHMMITTKPEHQHTEHLFAFGQTGESAVLGKTLELPVKKKDGSVFTIELTVARTKLRGEWHAVGIMRDVTERLKQAAALAEQTKELQKFQLAVDHASDHIVITDPDGKVLYANQAVTRITGFAGSEVVGQKAGSKPLWGGNMGKTTYDLFWKTIKEDKKIFVGEFNNHRKNGETYIAEARVAPILDARGNVEFFVGIERDITHAKEVDRMKTEFISLASHQLRTPLSAMKWFSEMLLAGDAGTLTAEQKEYIGNIHQSNERMIALINSLLNISRIESGRIIIDPKPTDLARLVADVVKEVQMKLDEKKMQLTVTVQEGLPTVLVDPKLLFEVYKNLLTNAMKYTPTGGSITITVSRKGEEIVSKVQDTGYGIPKTEQDRVFAKFYRGTNILKKETEGTGLGLYLVKAIIDSSGGNIWFESEEHKGTTFWFSLPASGMIKQSGEVAINT